MEVDTLRSESVAAKGDASRHRTVRLFDEGDAARTGLSRGVVVTVRGLFAEVDAGDRVISCTIRRILRTRLIQERQALTVGDHVLFRPETTPGSTEEEAVIEAVEPRRGLLQRRAGRRIQIIAANIDQAIIVSSANEPPPKPNLIDRYVVSSLAGGITPLLCMNKIDLDGTGYAREVAERYAAIGMKTLCTSTQTGESIDALKGLTHGKSTVFAGQSGVGKTSLLNAIQPGLGLKVGQVSKDTRKGRHTTTTACLIRLDEGGYVVDTPGIRSFELGNVGREELEAYFVEFLPFVPECKFPDCTHRHESGCAVLAAVDAGQIHPERYESYVKLFEEPEQSVSR